jgi:hypothetical protein
VPLNEIKKQCEDRTVFLSIVLSSLIQIYKSDFDDSEFLSEVFPAFLSTDSLLKVFDCNFSGMCASERKSLIKKT